MALVLQYLVDKYYLVHLSTPPEDAGHKGNLRCDVDHMGILSWEASQGHPEP